MPSRDVMCKSRMNRTDSRLGAPSTDHHHQSPLHTPSYHHTITPIPIDINASTTHPALGVVDEEKSASVLPAALRSSEAGSPPVGIRHRFTHRTQAHRHPLTSLHSPRLCRSD